MIEPKYQIGRKDKFLLKETFMLNSVEENYLKLVAESTDQVDLLKKFKEEFQKSTKHTTHVCLRLKTPSMVMLETSKYVEDTSKFIDHNLWIFNRYGNGKYDWELKRYNIKI